jgi:hypothetical protein
MERDGIDYKITAVSSDYTEIMKNRKNYQWEFDIPGDVEGWKYASASLDNYDGGALNFTSQSNGKRHDPAIIAQEPLDAGWRPPYARATRPTATFPALGAQEQAMYYMYAVVEGLPPAWRPPPAVLAAASVDRRHLGPLLLLGSTLDAVPPANPRTLALHHDVVAEYRQARTGADVFFPAHFSADSGARHKSEIAARAAHDRGAGGR